MIIINEGCTIDHYWRVEARTEYKNEFIEGQIISHIGSGFRHGDIKLDRGAKWRHYQTVPSLREYVLVAHDRVRVERYLRRDDGWLYWSTTDIDAVVDLASVGGAIPVREIYDRVTFPTERKSMLIPPVDIMR
jgi:hypothetical protein